MSYKFLDNTGVAYLWNKIKAAFVAKDGSKVLSDNNFSTAEKSKLNGIEAGANNYSLPTASASVKGGVKVGANLSIDGSGVLSATTQSIGRYIVEVATTDFLEPTADEEELKAIATHFNAGEQCELKIMTNVENPDMFYVGHLTYKSTNGIYTFTVFYSLSSALYDYSVNTTTGAITVSHINSYN